MSQAFSLPFIRKEQISQDIWTFYFDKRAAGFRFLPGQYNRMHLPISDSDDRGESRMFTIASSPHESEFMVTTRAGASAFKKALFGLKPKTPVQFFGPLGGFILPKEDKMARVFLAGGIGITPFRSMLLFAAQKKTTNPITLFASFATSEDMAYFQELTSLSRQNPNLKIIYTLTHPEKLKKEWHEETGRISGRLIQKYVDMSTKHIYMVSGSPSFIDSMTAELHESLGVPEEDIKADLFTGY